MDLLNDGDVFVDTDENMFISSNGQKIKMMNKRDIIRIPLYDLIDKLSVKEQNDLYEFIKKEKPELFL
jgi:hypothetical protein